MIGDNLRTICRAASASYRNVLRHNASQRGWHWRTTQANSGQSIVGGRARQRFSRRCWLALPKRGEITERASAASIYTRDHVAAGNRVCDSSCWPFLRTSNRYGVRRRVAGARGGRECEEDDKTAAKQRGRNPERIRTSDPRENRGQERERKRERETTAGRSKLLVVTRKKVRSSGHGDKRERRKAHALYVPLLADDNSSIRSILSPPRVPSPA